MYVGVNNGSFDFTSFSLYKVDSSGFIKSNFVKVQSDSLSCTSTIVFIQVFKSSVMDSSLTSSELGVGGLCVSEQGSSDDSSRGDTQLEWWFISSFIVIEWHCLPLNNLMSQMFHKIFLTNTGKILGNVLVSPFQCHSDQSRSWHHKLCWLGATPILNIKFWVSAQYVT